jgi:hypothetical protein
MGNPQFDLFSSEPERKAKDESLARRERYAEAVAPKPYSEIETRKSIVRGFISLYFDDAPVKIISRPLDCLNGKTLAWLCEQHYDQAQAWMKEVRLHPEERKWYVFSSQVSQ